MLDASALLAYLQDEPGADVVHRLVESTPTMSSVNFAEVLSTLVEGGRVATATVARLRVEAQLGRGLSVAPLDEIDAVAIADLRPRTRSRGLSLADRACVALGLRLGVPVVTADRSWTELDLGVEVVPIR